MIGFILLGFVAGILSGVVGIGGGVLIVPALIFLFSIPQKVAQGTSLAFLLAPIGILAVWTYYKAGFVDVRIAVLLALGFIVGGLAGSKLAISLPADTLAKILGVFLILVGIKMLLGK